MTQAMVFFLLFLGLSALITSKAARYTTSLRSFYTADASVSGWQNGLALAGDYLSAAAFLGGAALYLAQGYDSLIYSVGPLAGWPLLLILFAEKLRQLGRYTVADILAHRYSDSSVRLVITIGTLTVTVFYLIVQMVGAGKLLELLFGLAYWQAVTLVGVLMIAYVSLGGMLATTGIQMVKACLMMLCALILAAGVMKMFHFSPAELFSHVAQQKRGVAVFAPSKIMHDPVDILSLGIGLTAGLLGLPHILMRFFTVKDTRAAKQSVAWATSLITLFFILNIIIGYGAIALVEPRPEFHTPAGKLLGGVNMAVIHLATLVGGETLRDLVAAVSFATILAVVAGLALAGAGAISHDLVAQWGRNRIKPNNDKNELRVSRFATVGLGLVAILLSILFQNQNVSFLLGLAFAIAASCNFPVLLLSLYWKKLTAKGVIWGCTTGMIAAIALIVASPAVWVAVLGNKTAWFPYSSPALFSVPLAFIAAWLGSQGGQLPPANAD